MPFNIKSVFISFDLPAPKIIDLPAPKTFDYLAFHSFDYEQTIPEKRVVRIKFDINTFELLSLGRYLCW